MHLAPGGPLAVYTLNPTITAQDIERIKQVFGLDQPLHIQYLKWASGIFTGNWGFTFFGGRPVLQVILERFPATLWPQQPAWQIYRYWPKIRPMISWRK